MNYAEILALAKKFNGKKGLKYQPLCVRFWVASDQIAFLNELPKKNYDRHGPCDNSEHYWVYVKESKK